MRFRFSQSARYITFISIVQGALAQLSLKYINSVNRTILFRFYPELLLLFTEFP